MTINQPSNQIKLTNVSLVKLKKAKKRFEIACYKNKVLEWRSGIEKDLDNVLQINSVFLNVSKGQTAPSSELAKAFGRDTSVNEIILEILSKGELQVGEKERQAQLERVHNEVISIIASKLVDPKTKRVYTPSMIEKALDTLCSRGSQGQHDKSLTSSTGEDKVSESKVKEHVWTGVVATKSAKSQALDAMKALITHQPIPVARARMKLRVTCPLKNIKLPVKSNSTKTSEIEEVFKGTVKDRILNLIEQLESQDIVESEWIATGFVEPGALKNLIDFIRDETKGQGRVEVLDMAINCGD
ncbi:Ribosome maturation protein SDO1 [Erysiphe neolycopersici]|uniref:Ribosome maturation protein SDO1 n=1 Tax=Erysiphe neolycopersici TaxID=212602 RepID=A0A420HXJ7_9PEZI|nr:Ribosome maturation protein SDO1 [Erysiphe neolycopersici]